MHLCIKKNQNAPRPSEHPPVRGKKYLCRELRSQICPLYLIYKSASEARGTITPAPLLFDIFFAAVINVAHHGGFGAPEEEKGKGRAGVNDCRKVSPGDAALGHALR